MVGAESDGGGGGVAALRADEIETQVILHSRFKHEWIDALQDPLRFAARPIKINAISGRRGMAQGTEHASADQVHVGAIDGVERSRRRRCHRHRKFVEIFGEEGTGAAGENGREAQANQCQAY